MPDMCSTAEKPNAMRVIFEITEGVKSRSGDLLAILQNINEANFGSLRPPVCEKPKDVKKGGRFNELEYELRAIRDILSFAVEVAHSIENELSA